MSRPRLRPVTLWMIAVVAATVAFVAHLSLRFETVRLGYDVGRARRAQRVLVEEQRLLSIEIATLRDQGRVEAIARGTLGMELPTGDRIVPVGAGSETRRASGRMR